MKNKRGQFYILAAVIIVLAVSGIASVQTYAVTKPEARKIQDISSELNEESSRIVDYGIYNGQDLDNLLDSFTDTEYAPYFLKKTENTDIVFIYGDKANLWGVRYNQESTGTISATIGGATTNWQIVNTFADRTPITDDDGDDIINVNLLGKDFEFDLRDNEMFYFIITQEKDGETYIERN